jgi:predicted aspartyl protease
MPRIPWLCSVIRFLTATLWKGTVGLILVLCLSPERLWAQSTIYSWTDEEGVVHYSNSMVPPQHSEKAERLEVAAPSLRQIPPTGQSGEIPLVILNNDPSQKFVRVGLQGERTVQEVLMLVDTGAQITLIDETLAEELDLEYVQDAMLAGVTGAARGWIGRLRTLRLGGEEVRDLPVMVGPMQGRRLLGMDVLEQLELSVSPRSLHRSK